MNIKSLVNAIHLAKSQEEKEKIMSAISDGFDSLPAEEQKKVQQIFLATWDEELEEVRKFIEKTSLSLKLEKVSKYVSMSYIARTYFGKSRQWLFNRIKGNLVNGKPATFTPDELKQLAKALEQLSAEMKETALQIAC